MKPDPLEVLHAELRAATAQVSLPRARNHAMLTIEMAERKRKKAAAHEKRMALPAVEK